MPKIPKHSSTAVIATLIQSIKHTAVIATVLIVRAKQESDNSPKIALGDVVLSTEKVLENGFVKPIDSPEEKPHFYYEFNLEVSIIVYSYFISLFYLYYTFN